MSMTTAELNRLAADTGCSKHDDCLTCPLPDCRYDTEAEVMKLRKIEEQTAIRSTNG